MKQCLIILSVLVSGCFNKPLDLDCDEILSIKSSVKNNYQADQVKIESKAIKEEIYLDEIRSIYITLYNATTRTLDFKSLPTNKYKRFENYEEIEKGLKNDGEEIFNLIKENCNLKDFNEVIVLFGKRGENDPLMYDFIVHYKL